MDTFSKRNNYSVQQKAITIREDAPHGLREFIMISARLFFQFKRRHEYALKY